MSPKYEEESLDIITDGNFWTTTDCRRYFISPSLFAAVYMCDLRLKEERGAKL